MWGSNVLYSVLQKLDENTLLWIKCVVQNVMYSVLPNARWRYISLNQMYGFAHVCFVLSSMKIRFFESNMWFKCFELFFAQSSMKKHFFESNLWFFTHLFCTKPEEDTLLWIKCEVQMFCTLFCKSSMKIRFFESNIWFKCFLLFLHKAQWKYTSLSWKKKRWKWGF